MIYTQNQNTCILNESFLLHLSPLTHALSHSLTLFPDLNDPKSSPGQSALAPTPLNFSTLSIEQITTAQSDIEANYYTLKSCMEIVTVVSDLSHRLQNRTSEVHRLNAQLSLLQRMYKDARAEISALKAKNKELKRQATSMAQFGVPSYSAFDG
ncbi:unnamed protein product [Camellia sinensis]